jgi:uncharacterized protein
MGSKALIVMAKRPFPGRTKTRLTPFFSPGEAAMLYECFLRDAVQQARSVPGAVPFIAYAPNDADSREYMQKLAPDFGLLPQVGDTLGERLHSVLAGCQSLGFAQVAAMNSDSPSLPAAYLARAFMHLDDDQVDVVLGPCEDGGYYLIGWKRPSPRLVCGVQMSTSHVLEDTLAIARQEKLRVVLLPSWYDVDEQEDLVRVFQDLEGMGQQTSHTRDFLAQRRPELVEEEAGG